MASDLMEAEEKEVEDETSNGVTTLGKWAWLVNRRMIYLPRSIGQIQAAQSTDVRILKRIQNFISEVGPLVYGQMPLAEDLWVAFPEVAFLSTTLSSALKLKRASIAAEYKLTVSEESLATRLVIILAFLLLGVTLWYLRDVSQQLEELDIIMETMKLDNTFTFYQSMTIFFGERLYELKYAEHLYLELQEQLKWEICVAEVSGRPGAEGVLPVTEIVNDAENLMRWLSGPIPRNGTQSLQERLAEAKNNSQPTRLELPAPSSRSRIQPLWRQGLARSTLL